MPHMLVWKVLESTCKTYFLALCSSCTSLVALANLGLLGLAGEPESGKIWDSLT